MGLGIHIEGRRKDCENINIPSVFTNIKRHSPNCDKAIPIDSSPSSLSISSSLSFSSSLSLKCPEIPTKFRYIQPFQFPAMSSHFRQFPAITSHFQPFSTISSHLKSCTVISSHSSNIEQFSPFLAIPSHF